MCIIAIKPAGVAMPAEETIENMWYGNPDGAGFMYNDAGRVIIEKGFMKLTDFTAAINKVKGKKERTIIMHFRITTHGGTKPENCHPFPVSDKLPMLQKRRTTAALGMAHNGIITINPRKGISDTMEYDLTQLSVMRDIDQNFYKKDKWRRLIYSAITSKMAFLDGTGYYSTVGDFTHDNGLLYSNSSYQTPAWSKYAGYDWGDDWGAQEVCYHRHLMDLYDWSWLESGAMFFVEDEFGEVFETSADYANSWALDMSGDVYVYDYEADVYIPCPGFSIRDEKWNVVKYDKDLAKWGVVDTYTRYTGKKEGSELN